MILLVEVSVTLHSTRWPPHITKAPPKALPPKLAQILKRDVAFWVTYGSADFLRKMSGREKMINFER